MAGRIFREINSDDIYCHLRSEKVALPTVAEKINSCQPGISLCVQKLHGSIHFIRRRAVLME